MLWWSGSDLFALALCILPLDHCNCWYHGDCVNVPIGAAQRLLSYLCPKCCLKSSEKSQQTYQFGTVVFRHQRPSLHQCYDLLAWLEAELARVCPSAEELILVQHVRSFRAILTHVEEFKRYVAPWLTQMTTIDSAAPAATPHAPSSTHVATSTSGATSEIVPAAAAAAVSASPSVTPSAAPTLDPHQLAHLKGCIRQGKKLGIAFPELPLLKRRYNIERQKKAVEGPMPAGRLHVPSMYHSANNGARETIEID